MFVLFLVGGSLGPSIAFGVPPSPSQAQTVDRIVARVEGDIVLLSEMRELAAYQELIDGRSQSQKELVSSLVEQWVLRTEAQEAGFPRPDAEEVDAQLKGIRGGFPSESAYRDRLAAVGLTAEGLGRIIEQQLYLASYLDYKFRPVVQVDDEEVAKYYQDELVPALRARGATPPPLEDVGDRIHEVLVQRGITEQASAWFEETKSRLQIETDVPPAMEGKR
jgi:hypothetical protein